MMIEVNKVIPVIICNKNISEIHCQIDGVTNWGFSRYYSVAEDVLRVCTEIRGSDANAELPHFLCCRGNPRGRLLGTLPGTRITNSRFGLGLRLNAWQGGDGVLVIGDTTYIVVDRNENVDHFS
jgi:hypothetical protein